MERKLRKRVPQEIMVRAKLQQAIGSRCPFCTSEDVGHFHIHHIDENPSNNDISNLLLLCPNCHSKITKGEIPQTQVIKAKEGLLSRASAIEIASISIDTKNCGWLPYDAPNAFFNPEKGKESFPILNFGLINHLQRTILLREIHLNSYHLPSGLSGIPRSRELKPIARYNIPIPDEGKRTRVILDSEIEVPSNMAFKFQTMLFYQHSDQRRYQVDARVVLNFAFAFNAGMVISAPDVYLNCKSRNEPLRLYSLG